MFSNILLRQPTIDDGADVFYLVQRCPPLDNNSSYCNFLQCSHFSTTSVAALQEGKLVGFISAYILPQQPDTLFVWQIAIDKSLRGQGMAPKMVKHILERPTCSDVRFIETTITPDNQSSWRVFEKLASQLESDLKHDVFLDKDQHFNGQHESEALVRIGPYR
ncbi:diaminobutyrate acetyltransferase [Saccharobesus litoralis]|uniref:L-2,4-diaminobutyric acid acetyltransferase n=1 Tax=Saccharobesus litoralis TaxID=2172099 RepID=A0A2S0VLY3_9ALTE|nr:diaminobutyrate acetyltransferase [Saccharobesus litoralis]AWB65120.1 diaminobutyrate acetyltransferase [Saccharobesus litoralis]